MRTASHAAGSLLRSRVRAPTVAVSRQVTICAGSVEHQATPVTSPMLPCITCGGLWGHATCRTRFRAVLLAIIESSWSQIRSCSLEIAGKGSGRARAGDAAPGNEEHLVTFMHRL